MKTPVTFAKIWRQIKKRFWLWLAVSVVAGLAVLFYNYKTKETLTKASVVVNFGYEGIDQGLDPEGNWFDVNELKNAEVIERAAAAVGLSVDDGQVEAIRQNITIAGSLPKDIIGTMTSYSSAYESSSISTKTRTRATAYYPTQYTMRLDYRALGYTKAQGEQLLQAITSEYKTYFYNKYGYKADLVNTVLSADFSEYDYENAITVLDSRMAVLSGYVSSLMEQDKTAFRSKVTGYSFADIQSAVETIRAQDISRLSSYISSNNVTRSWKERAEQYKYMVEEAERSQLALEERLAMLDATISTYVKPQTVVMGTAGVASSDGTVAAYQISQRSETYDALVQQRVELQTELSELKENISLYKQQIAQMRSNSSAEETAYVEEQLNGVVTKIKGVLTNLDATAKEYYNTVGLENAFQLVRAEKVNLVKVIRGSLGDGVAVEALIFGIFLAAATLKACGKEESKPKKIRGKQAVSEKA